MGTVLRAKRGAAEEMKIQDLDGLILEALLALIKERVDQTDIMSGEHRYWSMLELEIYREMRRRDDKEKNPF
jgi:hypothetical protein